MRHIGALLVLFVFTLPLHFHAAAEELQINQECTCYCGGRPELGSLTTAVVLSAGYAFILPVTRDTQALAALAAEAESARAPPYSL